MTQTQTYEDLEIESKLDNHGSKSMQCCGCHINTGNTNTLNSIEYSLYRYIYEPGMIRKSVGFISLFIQYISITGIVISSLHSNDIRPTLCDSNGNGSCGIDTKVSLGTIMVAFVLCFYWIGSDIIVGIVNFKYNIIGSILILLFPFYVAGSVTIMNLHRPFSSNIEVIIVSVGFLFIADLDEKMYNIVGIFKDDKMKLFVLVGISFIASLIPLFLRSMNIV